MLRPKDRDDILRLNGMVSHLGRFLPHLSDVRKPLRDLTHKDAAWCWDDLQEKAWNDVKKLIALAPVLAYYKPTEVLEMQCDSSQSGLGAAKCNNTSRCPLGSSCRDELICMQLWACDLA